MRHLRRDRAEIFPYQWCGKSAAPRWRRDGSISVVAHLLRRDRFPESSIPLPTCERSCMTPVAGKKRVAPSSDHSWPRSAFEFCSKSFILHALDEIQLRARRRDMVVTICYDITCFGQDSIEGPPAASMKRGVAEVGHVDRRCNRSTRA